MQFRSKKDGTHYPINSGKQKYPIKKQFFGPCDRIRQTPDGESWWNRMMENKQEITEKEFIAHVDPRAVLDEDETWEDYNASMKRQDEVKYYKSADGVYFFQTAGFEFFWK